MTFPEILDYGWKIGASIGGSGIGIGMLIRLASKDGRQEKTEIINSAAQMQEFWKKQALEEKEARIVREKEFRVMLDNKEKAWNGKFQAMQKELGETNGRFIQAEKQRKEYLDILQNKDPESKTFMEETVHTLGEISKFMEKINKHMESESGKELHIDATVSKTTPNNETSS